MVILNTGILSAKVLVNNTNLTFLYKINKRGAVLSRHALSVPDFQILIQSCSIESRNDPSPKNEMVHETKFRLKNLLFIQHIEQVLRFGFLSVYKGFTDCQLTEISSITLSLFGEKQTVPSKKEFIEQLTK